MTRNVLVQIVLYGPCLNYSNLCHHRGSRNDRHAIVVGVIVGLAFHTTAVFRCRII